MSYILILIDVLSSASWEKKEKGKKKENKQPGTLFPGPEVGHTLMGVPGWIFLTIRCN
jgi:hypothetical protein